MRFVPIVSFGGRPRRWIPECYRSATGPEPDREASRLRSRPGDVYRLRSRANQVPGV